MEYWDLGKRKKPEEKRDKFNAIQCFQPSAGALCTGQYWTFYLLIKKNRLHSIHLIRFIFRLLALGKCNKSWNIITKHLLFVLTEIIHAEIPLFLDYPSFSTKDDRTIKFQLTNSVMFRAKRPKANGKCFGILKPRLETYTWTPSFNTHSQHALDFVLLLWKYKNIFWIGLSSCQLMSIEHVK